MISSINSHASKMSEHVDYLQPVLLRKISQIDFVLDNSYLVSSNIEYLNILLSLLD